MTHSSESFSEHSSLVSWTSEEFWKWSPFYSLVFETNWIYWFDIWIFVLEMNGKVLYELCSVTGLSFCLCHLQEGLWSDQSSPLLVANIPTWNSISFSLESTGSWLPPLLACQGFYRIYFLETLWVLVKITITRYWWSERERNIIWRSLG